MAGASDKARFYLEQSVPELQDLAAKKIFSKEEINSIAKKRSDFEHILNARSSKPSDYARYAEYEMNLESLRRKRVKRLGVKNSNHTGQRRIFFVLDRATKKFHGDIALWMQYIGFARKQKSNKKVSQILTSVLRLHPTKVELWIYAANYAIEERGDITEARSYMQRGLRFCKTSERAWVEYARLEMIYIAKIVGRRRILGLDQEEEAQDPAGTIEEAGGDLIALPAITAEDISPDHEPSHGVNQDSLERLGTSPALSGAIPIAIFDAAMKQFKDNDKICREFFDMVAEFVDLPCTDTILQHIMNRMQALAPQQPETLIRWIQQPILGVKATSAGFPTMLEVCLDRINASFKRLGPDSVQDRGILGQQVIEWMLPYLGVEDLDPDIRKVIIMTLRKLWSQFQADTEQTPLGRAAEVAGLLEKFDAQEFHRITEPARVWALSKWPGESRLFTESSAKSSVIRSIA
ncbi:U3 small nucleolar RNA-associated protein 6, partial [Lecanoromycetidae sp. Uapishka_2]